MFAAGCGRGRAYRPSDGDHFIERFILVPPSLLSPPHLLALHTKSQLEMERLEKIRRDLREAVLTAVILASGMWMIVSGLMKLWGE
jgi:hypothetical protein